MGGSCEDRGETHRWGPVETARFTGNPHRKCERCRWINMDFDDDNNTAA